MPAFAAGGEEALVDLDVERAVRTELRVHVVRAPRQRRRGSCPRRPAASRPDRVAGIEQQRVLGASCCRSRCRNQRPSQYFGPADRVVGRLAVVAVDRAVEHRRARGGDVRAQLGRRGAVVRARCSAPARTGELRAAVVVARVAAAVPDVQRARRAGVLARARGVRQGGEAGVVRRVVDEVLAVVPAVRRAGGRAAVDVARGVGGAQRSRRRCDRGRPAGCPCSTASHSCRRSGAAWRSRTSTDPASPRGRRRPARPTRRTGRRSSGRSPGATGCAGPSRRSRAWSCRRRPSVPSNRFGPFGEDAVGSPYVVPTPIAGFAPSASCSIGLSRSILPL